jgi:hypothetical protein
VERIDEEIERSLRELAEFLGADPRTLFQFTPSPHRRGSWSRASGVRQAVVVWRWEIST